jgi:hypothetical protein
METPSNPLTEIIDIRAVADIAHACGALLAVDNCFCSPALQKPLSLGAVLVVHSATKYIDGQGRVLGGAVVGSHELLEKLYLFVRSAGPTTAPPSTRPWPSMYLVAECTTRTAPRLSGFCSAGEQKQLSTASSAPQAWAMSATARMSMISVSGLDGVSMLEFAYAQNVIQSSPVCLLMHPTCHLQRQSQHV